MKLTRSACFYILFLSLLAGQLPAQDTLPTARTEAILYLGQGPDQPLIVGLGGSEGGNAWAGAHWKNTRDALLAKGYAFLAIGYFGVAGAPALLDRIALEDIHDAIVLAAGHPSIRSNQIAIIGGSRGGDLALLLASYYPDISCVVGLVSSHAVFPGHTMDFNSSCWTFGAEQLPFIPVNEAAVPFLMKRDLRGTFTAMLQDSVAEEKSLIRVERIHGPILLLSATQDEICPSTPMADKMIARLKEKQFKHPYQHIAIDGTHAAPLEHFDLVFAFLDKYFKVE